MIVGQGPIALAVGAGGGCSDIFSLVYLLSFLSPSLWGTARYRLKCCLKGQLHPKQTKPNHIWISMHVRDPIQFCKIKIFVCCKKFQRKVEPSYGYLEFPPCMNMWDFWYVQSKLLSKAVDRVPLAKRHTNVKCLSARSTTCLSWRSASPTALSGM